MLASGFSAPRQVAVVAALAVSSCGRSGSNDDEPELAALVDLTPAFGALMFPFAVDLLQHPTDDQRWYVVEKRGVVETFHESDPAGTRSVAVTLNGLLSSGESGLLGMTLHPAFATTGEVFLSYVVDDGGSGTSVVARFLSPDGGLTFVPGPGPDPIVLSLVQPFTNHNGGDIDFGPDGRLYVAFGDGGGSGDPNNNAQNTDNWFGSILRLDPDSARPYAVPPDNPLVGVAGMDEIWAYGLRNPWRMSFDTVTGALWLGDVGQATVEEIDVIVRGGNYGWNLQEGHLSYPAGTPSSPPGFIAPIAVHLQPETEAITGGFVYHGTALPQLQDHYVYGDFVTGRIFALNTTSPSPLPEQLFQGPLNISSFGQARNGEIYVVAYGSSEPMQQIVPLPSN